jgi:predicted GIY-YIG superfamily endonuclease
VLKGKSGKRYIGITNNLSRRLQEHRGKTTKAGQLLGDFFVLYTEEFPDYKTAREREKFMKSGQGRKWLDELESNTGPARGGRVLAPPTSKIKGLRNLP